MNKQNNRAGFTLVETIMYVFLLASVLLVLLNVGIFLSSSSLQTTQRSLLIGESTVVTNRIFRDVKSANLFVENESTLGVNNSVLVVENNDADEISFRVQNGYLQRGLNGVYSNLHSIDVIVNEFTVTQLNSGDLGNLFKFEIEFESLYGDVFSLTRSVNFIYD